MLAFNFSGKIVGRSFMTVISFCKKHLKLAPLFLMGLLSIYSDLSFAETNTTSSVPNQVQPLPLSSTEIKKLKRLFPIKANNNDAMPEFSNEVPHEHFVWKEAPLVIILPINKERMINFPEAIAFGYNKNNLPDSLLRVQNNAGTLYLLAKAPFATQRVAVRLAQTGKIVLLDISAQKAADTTPIDVILPEIHPAADALSQAKITENDQNHSEYIDKASINEITLMRFAVQQLYAPKRLLTQPNGIYRTPMHAPKIVPLLRDGSAMAMPLASWRSGDRTITAILLRNTLKQVLTLDPRVLCGAWQAATFYPRHVLAPAGTPGDSTTVFLIANQSFSNVLKSCMTGA